jgi:hypothetical protein
MVHGMIESDMIYGRDTFHGKWYMVDVTWYGTCVDVHGLYMVWYMIGTWKA